MLRLNLQRKWCAPENKEKAVSMNASSSKIKLSYARFVMLVCVGDKGDPLICGGELVGIAAFGIGYPCYSKGGPGGFTYVFKFVDWIRDVIDANSD